MIAIVRLPRRGPVRPPLIVIMLHLPLVSLPSTPGEPCTCSGRTTRLSPPRQWSRKLATSTSGVTESLGRIPRTKRSGPRRLPTPYRAAMAEVARPAAGRAGRNGRGRPGISTRRRFPAVGMHGAGLSEWTRQCRCPVEAHSPGLYGPVRLPRAHLHECQASGALLLHQEFVAPGASR